MSAVSVQVNVRLDEAIVEQIDGWAVVRGVSRPELVRAVLTEWIRRQERERIEDEYRQAYAAHPETDDDLRRAADAARRLVDEEPWESWW
jgi:metal-responsive CopG/Arc/MetJ family transcriptional regulator